jgi:hypothetical protein
MAKEKRAILVGAGHAHLLAAKRASEFTRRGYELVVISPGAFWYSGLATGMLGGIYPPIMDRIAQGDMAAIGWTGDMVSLYKKDHRERSHEKEITAQMRNIGAFFRANEQPRRSLCMRGELVNRSRLHSPKRVSRRRAF